MRRGLPGGEIGLDWRAESAVLAALFIGGGVRLLLLVLPAPFLTDVYYYDAQAAAFLVHGTDPYGQTYSVPLPLVTPGAGNIFAYLPGLFVFVVPAWALWDPRLGLVVADLLVAVCLWLLRTPRASFYSAAYILLPPTVLFSTWFINDGLPAITFILLAVFFERRHMVWPAGVLWGLSLASSQEAWLVFPFYAYLSIRRRNAWGPLVSIGSAAAVIVPFLLRNPVAFVNDTIVFQFSREAATFISTGPFGLNINPSLEGVLRSFGLSLPLLIRGVIAAMVFLLILLKTRRTLSSTLFSAALFSVVGLVILAGNVYWAYFELPFALLLAWGALREQEEV